MADTQESASTPPFLRLVYRLLVPVPDLQKESRSPAPLTTRLELVYEFTEEDWDSN